MGKTKICIGCNDPLHVSDFNKRSDSPDKLQSLCKECSKATHKKATGVKVHDLTKVKEHALALLNVDEIEVNSGSVGKKALINLDCVFRGLKTNVVVTVKDI